MIYDKSKGKTFESQKVDGVNYYDYRTAWTKIVAYSVKSLPLSNPKPALEAAYKRFVKTPYTPNWILATSSLEDYFRKWSLRDDLDSMYCSKLVWQTFIKYGIDLYTETGALFYPKRASFHFYIIGSA